MSEMFWFSGKDWKVRQPLDIENPAGACFEGYPRDFLGSRQALRMARAEIASHLMGLDALDRDRVAYLSGDCSNAKEVIDLLEAFGGKS